MKYILYIIIFILTSCNTTKYIEVPKETTKTEYLNKIELKHDSIYIRDSVETFIRNDTVYITKVKLYYKYRDKIIKDTICKTDTLIDTKIVTKEVIKEVNRIKTWQQILMIVGGGFIGLLLYKITKLIK